MDDDDDGIVAAQIIITRRYYPDRSESADCVAVEVEGEPTLVEILGLLEFAKADSIAELVRDCDEED